MVVFFLICMYKLESLRVNWYFWNSKLNIKIAYTCIVKEFYLDPTNRKTSKLQRHKKGILIMNFITSQKFMYFFLFLNGKSHIVVLYKRNIFWCKKFKQYRKIQSKNHLKVHHSNISTVDILCDVCTFSFTTICFQLNLWRTYYKNEKCFYQFYGCYSTVS